MEILKKIRARALGSGASDAIFENVQKEFITGYLWQLLKSGAKYEQAYLNGTISRPLIAKKLVDVARRHGAALICHGATGKGNDQVRFEVSIAALAPEIRVVAPWRSWNFVSREQCMEYAKSHNIEVDVTKKSPCSVDKNIWYPLHEGGVLEDCKNEFPLEILEMTQHPKSACDSDCVVKISFKNGIPVAVNDIEFDCVLLMQKLNEIWQRHGIGLVDIIENRVVGMKSRGVYEFPAAEILYQAHQKLESITLTKDVLHYKQKMALEYADLIYTGLWFSPLKKCLDVFINETQKSVNGDVVLRLYKGNILSVSIFSPNSLYNPSLAGFTMRDEYNQKDAEGFIKIFGLPIKVAKMVENKRKNS